jgi:uncharacterized membrane protein
MQPDTLYTKPANQPPGADWCICATDYQLIQQLREKSPAQTPPKMPFSFGDRLVDQVVAIVGSWRFILIQSFLLTLWIIVNVAAYFQRWDPYPFILLNLMLSFQAAYTAPIIMMSQNRQSEVDRVQARHDYEVNLKAELEIELLHDRLSMLRQKDISPLVELIKSQQQQLERIEARLNH